MPPGTSPGATRSGSRDRARARSGWPQRFGARAMSLLDSLVPARAVTTPFAAALAPSAARFLRALARPEEAQRRAFARAREHVLALRRVKSLEHLRDLPLCNYDDVAADIDRVADGVGGLTRDQPIRFELSGGSSGAQKLIPITRAFLDEMNRALLPWLFSLYARTPGVAAGCAYWSVSPMGAASRERRTTRAGIPIGGDDASWFPPALQPLIARVLAVPSSLARYRDVDACRYATLRLLLERDDLSLISVWSPTFLTLLMSALDRERARLLDDLARGTLTLHEHVELPLRAMPERAERLRAGEDPWPKLALISMWTDAAAASFAPAVTSRFPTVPVQPKGLLATEGVTSIPWGHGAPVLAVRSHVVEFLDEHGAVRFAHEIEDGATYEVVLTTSSGLVRYRTGDLVRVDGACEATPRVRFLGRAGMVSDLVGEKLAASFVGRVLADVVPRATFAMLAPHERRYRLYVEGAVVDAHLIEERLCEGHPYRYARALGQLDPVEVVIVRDGTRVYERACVARGQRAGDVKPTPLHPARDWSGYFSA
jgi:hypothetical protein